VGREPDRGPEGDKTGRHITLEEVMRPAISVRQDARAGDALKVMLDNEASPVFPW
jgi:hypothetical protein